MRTWFITGISSGIGKALSESVIENNDFVIGTFRKPEQVKEFNDRYGKKALGVLLDITNFQDITNIFSFISEEIGKIDILVNNAGFGISGAIEETSIEEVREVFEANFFGTLAVTQAALPYFRKQKSGHIIQISSHGGIKSFPGFGIYNASKFALEGFSEALAGEVTKLGIKVTIVEPGPFRTKFAGDSFKQAKNRIDDYNSTAGVFREKIKMADGNQEGDPNKAAQAIINITKLESPPLRLPLGAIAINTISSKLESIENDLKNFRQIAANAIF